MGQSLTGLRGADDVKIKKALDAISEEQYGSVRRQMIDNGVATEDELENDLEAAKMAVDRIPEELREAIVEFIDGDGGAPE